MPILVACDQCGLLVQRYPSQIAAHVFCDKECRRVFITTPLALRFWRSVNKTPTCWIWQGARGGSQAHYGVISTVPLATNRRRYKLQLAHRVAWELLYGPIPVGLDVCHNCPEGDNPLCVNPDHLFLGTQADNMRDMIQKNRQPRPMRKLSLEQAREALAMRGIVSQKTLAKKFGVSARAIQNLHERKTYLDIGICAVEELNH